MTEQEIKTNRFKDAMINELINNARKGDILSWRGIEDKIVDLEYHKAKMLLAIRQKNAFAIREYIADCANILMSIGNEFGVYDWDIDRCNMESILVDDPIRVKPLSSNPTKRFTS